MNSINEIRFSGTIDRLKSVDTKTGTSMATLLLIVGQQKFKAVAFKNVATAILKCSDGDYISVAGSGSINSWKDNENKWHNDFQLTIWEAEIDGVHLKYEKNNDNGGQLLEKEEPPLPPEPNSQDEFDYREGPF